MFFLEARDKVQKDEELAGGDVEVGNSAAAQQTQTQTSSASAKKKKKKKK